MRPTGITILVILEVIGALLLLIAGLAVAAFSGFIGMYIPPGTLPPQLLAGLGIFVGAFLVILSLLGLIVAWGLWTGKRWSWYIAFILAILGAIGGLASLPSGVLELIVNVLIIWYLWQTNVKAFYSMGPPTPTVTLAPQSTTPPGNVIFCSKCGTANLFENVFCKNCGAPLKTQA